jgi:hypothetical protein
MPYGKEIFYTGTGDIAAGCAPHVVALQCHMQSEMNQKHFAFPPSALIGPAITPLQYITPDSLSSLFPVISCCY